MKIQMLGWQYKLKGSIVEWHNPKRQLAKVKIFYKENKCGKDYVNNILIKEFDIDRTTKKIEMEANKTGYYNCILN